MTASELLTNQTEESTKMKIKLSRCKQLYTGEYSNYARYKPTAFALAFMSISSTLLPAQTVQAQGASVLEEVIVTARKREESMQDTPIAVNVLTADTLNSSRIEGIEDLGTIVPGLVTSRTAASSAGSIYLRGVGTGAGNGLFDQAVAINIDGIGVSSPQLMTAGMFDLERIEVLRGPQALFYGKNSPGGVIALHTKDPTDEFELELTAMYETEGEEPALRAIVSGPFSQTLSGRLSMGWSKADNHLFDIVNFDVFETGPDGEPVQTAFGTSKDPLEIEKTYAIGTLLWEPTDRFSANLKYAHLEEDQDGSAAFNLDRTQCGLDEPQTIYPVPGIDNCKLDDKIIASALNPVLVAADGFHSDYRGDVGGFDENEVNFFVLEMNYEMANDLSLVSVTGYFDNENERLAESSWQVASGLLSSGIHEHEQWSQELRLSSNYDGAINFTLGAYYEEKDITSGQGVVIGSNFVGAPVGFFGVFAIPGGTQVNTQDGTAYSAFAQLDWDLNEKLTLSAGARYSYEEKEAGINIEVGAAPEIGQPPVPATDILLLDDKPDWSNVSPELTLSYFFSDDVMFFASYRTGFKSGGIDGSFDPNLLGLTFAGIPFDAEYDEETVEGFEVGMKSTLLEGTLRLNLTAYSYDYEDMQMSVLQSSGGLPSLHVLNAAEATVEGIELESYWLTPIDGLSLSANIAWSFSEYGDYIADCFVGQTIAEGCNLDPDPETGNFTATDMSGESLAQSPDLSATLGLDYMVAISGNWNLALNVTTSYKDDYPTTALNYPDEYRQDSYWWTNAAVSVFSNDEKWEFFVRGVNLGDERFASEGASTFPEANPGLTGTNNPNGRADFFQFVNGGRQLTLGLTYRF
jgi:outer membrane receptor protein involved in Fe transport